jgi:dienelactone hydrolase
MYQKFPIKDGQVTGYLVYLPDAYDPKDTATKWPVKFLYHGDGQIGDGSEASLDSLLMMITNPWYSWGIQVRKNRFILICPQLLAKHGNWVWDTGKFSYAEDALKFAAQFNIDTSRMYWAGISRGGGMVWAYPASTVERGKKFAAIISCCGIEGWNANSNIKSPTRAYHSETDGVVDVQSSKQAIANITAGNPPVKPQFIPIGTSHDIWGLVFQSDDLYNWMLAQSTSGTVPVQPSDNPPPLNPTATLNADASATVTTVSGTTAVLDGRKSVGYKKSTNYSDLSWRMIKHPDVNDPNVWDVFPGYNQIGEVVNIKNLHPGEYVFELVAGDDRGNKDSDQVKITVLAGKKIVVDIPIPVGKTRVIQYDDNSIEFK